MKRDKKHSNEAKAKFETALGEAFNAFDGPDAVESLRDSEEEFNGRELEGE